MPGSSEPISSSSPSARAALIVTAAERLVGRQPELEAGDGHRQRQAGRRRRARVEVRADRDRDAPLDERPGRRVVVLHQEPGRRRQDGRDDRPALGRGRGERVDAGLRRRREVVRRRGPELGRQLRAARRGQLVGVEPRRQPVAGGRLEDPPRLVRAEHAVLAEDVAEPRPAVGGDAGQLLLDDRADVGLGAVRPRRGTRAGRRGRRGRSGRRRSGPRVAEPVGDLEQPDLGLEVEAVAGLRLDRRDAVAEHLVEPAPAVRQQRRRSMAARVAATVDRIPPPAARISR